MSNDKKEDIWSLYDEFITSVGAMDGESKLKIKYFANKILTKVKFELTISSPFIVPYVRTFSIVPSEGIDTIGVLFYQETRRIRIIYNPYFIYWVATLDESLDYIRFILIHE